MRSEELEKGTRGSALWGRGSKSRLGAVGHSFVLIAALLVALTVGAGASLAAVNGFAKPKPWGRPAPGPNVTAPGPNYQSTATYPDGSLFARAQQDPTQSYKVIVQTDTSQSQGTVQNWSGNRGRFRHRFGFFHGFSATLPGWAILYLNEHPTAFGRLVITEDEPVALLGQTGPDNWQGAIAAAKLWSHGAVTCQRDSLGALLDPTCLPLDAYVAPQAPAIAIIDSGIDASDAADFGTRVATRVNFASDNAAGDPLGHGTMVAGVAAGAANSVSGGGVAQNAPIVDLRVADAQGRANASDVIAALDWVLQNKAQYHIGVVNLSLAGLRQTSFVFDPLDQAVERLWLNGVVVVAAAGNNGNPWGATRNLGAPGNDPFVITVGATDTNGTPDQSDDFLAPWSAWGYTPDGFRKPELAAPGRYMLAPVSNGSQLAAKAPSRVVAKGYMWMSGTSFAAPAVAGLAAQLLALHPGWTPGQVKGALMAGAVPLASVGAGAGEVNAAASANLASPPDPNSGLEAFVQTDSDTGQSVFSASAWVSAVKTNSAWTSSAWTSSAWTSSAWTSSAWTSSAWTSSAWTSSAWTSSAWVE
jgi:serine protease AprX